MEKCNVFGTGRSFTLNKLTTTHLLWINSPQPLRLAVLRVRSSPLLSRHFKSSAEPNRWFWFLWISWIHLEEQLHGNGLSFKYLKADGYEWEQLTSQLMRFKIHIRFHWQYKINIYSKIKFDMNNTVVSLIISGINYCGFIENDSSKYT